jgi:stress response protein SCP2
MYKPGERPGDLTKAQTEEDNVTGEGQKGVEVPKVDEEGNPVEVTANSTIIAAVTVSTNSTSTTTSNATLAQSNSTTSANISSSANATVSVNATVNSTSLAHVNATATETDDWDTDIV